MPKYIPTYEDLYEIRPCPVCGMDILEDNGAETCSYLCQQQTLSYQEDWNWWLEIAKEDYDDTHDWSSDWPDYD